MSNLDEFIKRAELGELTDDDLDKVSGGTITKVEAGYEVEVGGKKIVCATLEEATKINADLTRSAMNNKYLEEWRKLRGF